MKKTNRICNNNPKMTLALVLNGITITTLKIIKSFLFNILVFIIGFGLGYVIISQEVHYHAKNHELYQYVEELNLHLEKLNKMDEEYFKINNDVKFILKRMANDIAHEHHCNSSNSILNCNSKFGKKIWK